MWLQLMVLLSSLVSLCYTLDNGLARTPPMGWLTWTRFSCNTNCDEDPDYCISEKLIMQMADHMAMDGYKDAGYEYVCLDDCWLATERDIFHRLQPDRKRFPHGMKYLADYVHSKGLKLGIYEDFGTKTCAGFPGSEFFMELDAKTFAEWGVDLLKFDTCHSDARENKYGYPAMSLYLNQTGQKILYSCEWPYGELQLNASIQTDYNAVRMSCNTWRNYWDVNDDFNSVKSIVNFYGKNNALFRKYSGPGGFFDPDQLLVGGFGMSHYQQRAQMAMWAMFSAPLIMSNDLRNIPAAAKQLLLNKHIISVDQDPLGAMAVKVWDFNGLQLWVKPMLPTGSLAIAFFNTNNYGSGTPLVSVASDLGMADARGYQVTEVFEGTDMGTFTPYSKLSIRVNPVEVTDYYGTILEPGNM